jgi:AraC-like DNA-binding protein
VFFNQDQTAICIDRAALSTPLHAASAEARRVAARALKQQQSFDPSAIVNRTQAIVRALLPYGADCSISAVAKFLGTSTRSLQRMLADAELSFEEIRDLIRADLARKYLLQSTLSIAEIADVLGYSQPSVFARSFRRWRGTTPLKFRQTRSVNRQP